MPIIFIRRMFVISVCMLSLVSLTSGGDPGFYDATFGKKPTEMAHGCFLCRGDVEVDVCAQCVNAAILMAVRSCPTSKRVVWWYGKNCMLRYSD
ncbi:hypothetical protein ACFX2G_019927 [Malus domestica]